MHKVEVKFHFIPLLSHIFLTTMASANASNEDFILAYEQVSQIVDYYNYGMIGINMLSLSIIGWLATNKKVIDAIGAYRWYILAQTISYSSFHIAFTVWQFFPLPNYTTKNGTNIYMYSTSGLGEFSGRFLFGSFKGL